MSDEILGITPAFPNNEKTISMGVSKRLFIATMIAQGSSSGQWRSIFKIRTLREAYISYCYEIADELLKQENES